SGKKEGQLMSNTVISVLEDSRRRLWVGTNAGLHLYRRATDDFDLVRGTPDSALNDNVIKVLAEDAVGRLWIGTQDGGLNMLMPGGKGFRNYKNTGSSNRIYSISSDSSGSLWLGTEEGLNIFDPRTGQVQRVLGNIRSKYSLKGKSVRSIYTGKNGIYWVGTYQSGVSKYDKNLTFFNLVQSDPFDPYGLSSPKVTSFAEKDRESVYVGTDDGGLNLYHRRTGLFDHLSLDPKANRPVSVMALERAGSDLWVGTWQQGVFVLNTINGAVRHFVQGSGPMGLSCDDIFCLHTDGRGNVWVGTNGKGVSVYLRETGSFKRLDDLISKFTGYRNISGAFIRSIAEDSSGNIWIGILGMGVVMLDQDLKTFRVFNRGKTGFPLEDVQALLPGSNGELWVGTTGNGLFRLDPSYESWKAYGMAQGLPSPSIFKILEDGSGKIWVSTNKGLSCLDPAGSSFKNYVADNGLQGSSFSFGSGLKASGGELFFGGLEGFNYFSPSELTYDRNVPAVVFTGLKVANETVVPGKESALKEDISVAQEIRLNYKQNFSIDFAALDYTSPRECQYLYMLEGFDKGWNAIGPSRTAVFTNLDPGRYTLKVRAHSPNDLWTTEPAAIGIYVKPPLWRTPFAYVFYVLLAAVILWGIRYRAIRRIQRRYAAEQERRRIEDGRKEAERRMAFDQAKIKFLTNL
ncbi:MAG TPA: two-component regulator propeller domain-containing protein, partial [Puia sp.]